MTTTMNPSITVDPAKAHAALGHEVLAAQQIALRAALNPSYTDDDHAH